ncbi:MAG: Ig-like domain-containing protein [Christensenellaceae bacterium]|jgi:uncharacterized protein YjdB|nr:Ig-like domain-containing protein [Christensenellaceae bacterium]
MKKVIVGMLLLLPLIIVASVLFAVDLISVQAYIAVERIELTPDILEIPLSDGEFSEFKAAVYPSKAITDVVFSIDSALSSLAEYEGDIATIDPKTGVLSLHSYGTLIVTATTTIGNKSDSCNVYIKGDKVEAITITSPTNTIKMGESLKLTTVFYPLDAIVRQITWESSDPNAIKVDQNGIVTGVGVKSNVKITARTLDGDVVGEIVLNSTEGASLFGDYFFIETQQVTLSSIGISSSNITGIENGQLNFDILSFINTSTPLILSTTKGNVTILKCAPNSIVIENHDILVTSSVRVMKLPLVLNAVYQDALRRSEIVNGIQWISSNLEAATISDSGIVTAKANGKNTKFTALVNDIETCSITVDVIKPISVLVLDKSESNDKRGIALQNLYGSKKITTALENNTLQIGVIFPVDVNVVDDLKFSVADPGLASVNSSGLVTLTGNFDDGKNVTVIVTVLNSPYESVTIERRYTFTVYTGVDCYTPSDIYKSQELNYNSYMRNDMEFKNGDKTIYLKRNLYGNGYLLSGVGYENKESLTSERSDRFNMVMVESSNVLVSNIILRNDDAERINIPDGLRGPVIQVGWTQGEIITGVRLEYSIFENGFYGIDAYNATLTVDGCIIRNISNFGIHIPAYNRRNVSYTSHVTINNCLMSQIVAPCAALTVDSAGVEEMPTLEVTGFFDMYNWQPLNSMRMLDRDFVEDEATNQLFKQLITSALANEFKKSKYDHIRYEIDDVKYLHLGIITAGAIYEYKGTLNIADKRILTYNIDAFQDYALLSGLKPVYLYLYTIESNITPIDEPVENAELYARLRGEKTN